MSKKNFDDEWEGFEEVNPGSAEGSDDFDYVSPSFADDEDDFEMIDPSSAGKDTDAFEEIRTAGDYGEDTDEVTSFSQATENYLDHMDEVYGDETEEAANPEAEEIRARAAGSERRERKRFVGENSAAIREEMEGGGKKRKRRGSNDRGKETRQSSGKKKMAVFGIAGGILVCACAVAVVILVRYQQKVSYYQEHFLPNTYINDIDCSNKTPEEVKQLFEDEVAAYQLTITGLDDDVVIANSDVNMTMNFNVDFTDLLNEQDHTKFREAEKSPQKIDVTTAVNLDEETLRSQAENLSIFSNMVESSDSSITYDETTELFVLNEAVHGNKVEKDAVVSRIVECFYTLQETLDLEEEGFYTAAVDSTDEMKNAVTEMNTYLEADISLDFDDAGTEALPKETIKDCLVLDDNYNVTFDSAPVTEWISELADKYDTYGKEHSFTTTGGSSITIDGGNYGWQIDQDATSTAVIEALESKQTVTQEPTYSQTAASHVNEVGSTYVEVNLTEQRLYFYRNDVCVLTSYFVSGCVSEGNRTPTGVYSIYSMERDRILKGDDYESHVDYWMPFYGGYGLHDASWRSNFGGSIYLTNGSHGCINLPTSKAKELYGYLSIGTPVVVYGGRTSYATEADTTEETETSETTTLEETTKSQTTEEESTKKETTTEEEITKKETTTEEATTRRETTTEEETTKKETTTEEETTKKETTTEEETTKKEKETTRRQTEPETEEDDEDDEDDDEEE